MAPVSRESYEVEGAPGPSLLGTGEGGEADWQLGIHSTTATYDALGRMVEIGSGGVYTQFSYRPDGGGWPRSRWPFQTALRVPPAPRLWGPGMSAVPVFTDKILVSQGGPQNP